MGVKGRRSRIKAGDKHHYLTAIKPAGYKIWNKNPPKKYGQWLFRCDCGTEVVCVVMTVLVGYPKSCGCILEGTKFRLKPGEAAFNLLFAIYKSNADKNSREFTLTREEFRELTSKNCYYCDEHPRQTVKHPRLKGNYLHNGLDRVDNTVGYISTNVVPCCQFCNKAKLDRPVEEFLTWAKRIYQKQCQL